MEKRKILMVGSGVFSIVRAKALALKHNDDLSIITETQAADLGLEIDLSKMREPKTYIFENIRIEDLPTPYLTDLQPKYPDKKNWKRKLKKNFKRPKK